MNKKVIISTFGPLHIVKASSYIINTGIELTLIQGWAPGHVNKTLEKIISKLSGRKNLSSAFARRRPSELSDKIIQCAFSEFFVWSLFTLHSKTNLLTYKIAARIGWWVYGFESSTHIKSAQIFHVRSGGGRFSIKKAHNHKMKVIVDHSIAHPVFLNQQLTPEYARNGMKYSSSETEALSSFFLKDMNAADVVLVNSDFVKSTLIKNKIPANKIEVIYLGVRPDFWGIKAEYETGEKIKILFTGGFTIRKGAEYLLMAMEVLDNQNFKYEMTVVGTFDLTTKVASKYNCRNVVFVEAIPQDELKWYLSTSDIYLFPSLAEGCASSGMEAMAAGLPVISTYESGLPIENNVDGIIIPSKNSDAIVNAVKSLSNDKALRKQLGTNATKKISTQYSWEQYSYKVAELYNKI